MTHDGVEDEANGLVFSGGNAVGAASVAGGERSSYFLRTLDRGMNVLCAFSGQKSELTLREVAASAGISRAATRRVLLTLADLGYVGVHDGRFSLRPKILQLSTAYLSGLTLREVALPHMERLSASMSESCSLAVLDGVEVVYVARIPTRRIVAGVITVGSRFPAFATALGRVLLSGLHPKVLDAHLAQIELTPFTDRTVSSERALRAALDIVRRQGYAVVDQELEIDLVGVAAPIRDGMGRVVAGVNLSTNANRRPLEVTVAEFSPALMRLALDIGRALAMATSGIGLSISP